MKFNQLSSALKQKAPTQTLRVTMRAHSDRGLIRKVNEDKFITIESSGIAVLADGMGGQAAGALASQIAAETVAQGLQIARPSLMNADPDNYEALAESIAGIVSAANVRILQRADEEPEKEGMGTTLDAFILLGSQGYIAHVGDSRVYRISRSGADNLITRDHSLAAALVASGEIAHDLAEPYRNVLLRSVGTSPELDIDVHRIEIRSGDSLVFCTDGVWQYFKEPDEIGEIVRANTGSAAKRLVEEAIRRGGQDNATVVITSFF